MVFFSLLGALWACYPLLTLQVYSVAKIWTDNGNTTEEAPRWLEEKPMAYVQQVIMKTAVHPYTADMLRNDAFRGPLASAFKLHLADILGFVDRETGLDMDHECLRTDGLSERRPLATRMDRGDSDEDDYQGFRNLDGGRRCRQTIS